MESAAPPPPPPQPETASRHHAYSRKQKSLGLLCSNFIGLYDREGVTSVGLDDAAARLGVERRRIYDIVNVLESVGVLSRKAKNQYTWKGFGAIPIALQELKEEGLKENFNTFHGNDDPKCSQASDDEEGDESGPATGSQNENPGVHPKSSGNSKNDNRREKSLALLTQNFVKLFVCSTVESISLDEAARLLLGDAHNASVMRTAKVRRIYDIANVLSSMNLIEKTHTADTRKPAYKWLGLKGKDAVSSASDESRKRAFGTDITNVSCKRGKVESSTAGKLEAQKQKLHETTVRQRERRDSIVRKVDRNNLEESKENIKSYQFGPFAPVTIARAGNFNMKKVDWDNLSSTYRPQYQNQGAGGSSGRKRREEEREINRTGEYGIEEDQEQEEVRFPFVNRFKIQVSSIRLQ